MFSRRLRFTATAVACLAAMFVGTTANASTSEAPAANAVAAVGVSGELPQTIHANDVTLHLYDHKCRVIGSDSDGNQGVACADLYYGDDGSNIWLQGGNEILCQNSAGTVVECAGIHETAALCWVGGPPCDTFPGVCGARFGHSPCGVRRVENAELVEFAGCSPEAWGDALNTSIVLPQSGVTVGGTGANEATSHIGSLCP